MVTSRCWPVSRTPFEFELMDGGIVKLPMPISNPLAGASLLFMAIKNAMRKPPLPAVNLAALRAVLVELETDPALDMPGTEVRVNLNKCILIVDNLPTKEPK